MYNRILDDEARRQYAGRIADLAAFSPEMFSRKIGAANVQQAFVLDKALKFAERENPKFLSAGAYEDTAGDTLKAMGYDVTDVDPNINVNLRKFVTNNPASIFDVSFATSVIEHVEDDEGFIGDMIQVTRHGGHIILTFDYRPDWQQGDKVPTTNHRLYNAADIERLCALFMRRDCLVLGPLDYKGAIDFEWEGIPYAFATMVALKL